MPRTMCFTSASGCSSVGIPLASEERRRAQSVLDLREVEVCFTLRGFAEGDDADFIVGLRVNYRNRDASKQAKRLEPLLAIGKARVFIGECESIEDGRRVNEIKAMILDIAGTFALGPGELHAEVYLQAVDAASDGFSAA